MSVLDPKFDALALNARLQLDQGLTVACYCAGWCDTCTQYRPGFDELAALWPQHTFVWVDIEESPELLDDDDVENFPTILIQDPQKGNLFYGTMLPHIAHLERLISHLDEASPAIEGGPASLRTLLLPPAAQ
ncbi:thiol reductase thioredoxin [Pollutimonas subterranea]|uniref:Thiol reductase thioredoxin n=1 Tax=Pollutimonas subterranea TaxID=2045210 RepID=A0A2N4U901_9BURK|nr:thioredoxin family protein [Pollutimonas subterranea]PLC51504.1 thiol reductase thioredoxin [Pollutimonas subterranea]